MEAMFFKEIPGYEGSYYVSSNGDVFRFNKNRRGGRPAVMQIKESTSQGGYGVVTLFKNKKPKQWPTHRLVALSFIINEHGKLTVKHMDGNKRNNNSDNLEWMTIEENNNHAIENGLQSVECKPVRQICKKTGIVVNSYKSIGEASRQNGFHGSNISKAVNGSYKSAYGFFWDEI